MFEGIVQYKDEHFGLVEYFVQARDSVSDIKFNFTIDNNSLIKYQNAYSVFDKEIDGTVIHEGNETRRIDVKSTNKVKTNFANKDFAVKFGSIIRYVVINATKNRVFTEEDDFSENMVGVVKTAYVDAKVYYKSGVIQSIQFTSPYFKVELNYKDEKELDFAIFSEMKEKDKYGNILSITKILNLGFSLNKDNLGFDYTYEIPESSVSLLGMYNNIEDVIEAHPEKNTSWILAREYVIVNDSNLDKIIKEFEDFDGHIAFDTETSGLNITFLSRVGRGDQLVGVVLSKKIGTGYYFPLQHKLFDNLCGGDHFYFMEKYMRNILETKKIICHNTSYDWKVAYIYDINVNVVFDTMLAFGVTKRYEFINFEYGLKSLASNLLGLDMFDLDDFIADGSWNNGYAFWDLPYEIVRRYGPADGDITLTLFEYIKKNKIVDDYSAKRVLDIELTFAKAVAYSEFYGYKIAVDKIPELTERNEELMLRYQTTMFELAGHEFNPNSSQQLAQVMYDELNIEMIDGKRSTAKDILKALTSGGRQPHPFVIALKNYRDAAGLHKNFLKKLKTFASSEGFIFPSVFALGTNTGRCSVKEPNYQSYNDVVKQYIVPRDGFIMFDSDFAQIEYRVLASLARQDSLIKAFDDPDLDYHSYQASRMFSVPYAAVTKQLRQQSKGINFGLPYGMGDQSLGAQIFGAITNENTTKAGELRRKFFQGQEKIEQFFEVVRSGGVSQGFTSTYWGRRRYYHKGTFSIASIRRQAGNQVIQGTAADIYKIAVNSLFNRIVREGLLGKVLFNAFVHDELLGEFHKSINPLEFVKMWREEFEVKVDSFCRLFAGLGFGDCWYKAKKQDLQPHFIDALVELAEDPKGRPLKDNIFDNLKETGFEWNEDIYYLIDNTNRWRYNFEYEKVVTYLQAEENQGEVIKPVIWSILTDKCTSIIADRFKEDLESSNDINDSLKYEVVKDGKMVAKSLQDYLKVFCYIADIDYSKVNILSADEVEVKTKEVVEDKKYSEYKEITEFDFIKTALDMGEYIVRLQDNTNEEFQSKAFLYADNFSANLIHTTLTNNAKPRNNGVNIYLVMVGADGKPNYNDIKDLNVSILNKPLIELENTIKQVRQIQLSNSFKSNNFGVKKVEI